MSQRKDIPHSNFPSRIVQSPILWLLVQHTVLILQSLILSLELKTAGCQCTPDGVMEADPSVNHALLRAMDRDGPHCPTA